MPRFGALALLAIISGCALTVVALLFMAANAAMGVVIGVGCATFGATYLVSPSWRLVVETSDRGIRVRRGTVERFAISWDEVKRVVANPENKTCFVNGGLAEKSLLVPGVDAPASYDLTDKSTLYDVILANVADERVTLTDSLRASP